MILSVAFRKGKGEKGAKVPTGANEPQNTLTAVVTLCPAEAAGCFDRCGHVKA